jgi:hypothetical protein
MFSNSCFMVSIVSIFNEQGVTLTWNLYCIYLNGKLGPPHPSFSDICWVWKICWLMDLWLYLLPALSRFHACLNSWPWKWKRWYALKNLLMCTGLHNISFQKVKFISMLLFICFSLLMGLYFKDPANSSHVGSVPSERKNETWMVLVMGYSEFPREALKFWMKSCKANDMKVGMVKTENVRKMKLMKFSSICYVSHVCLQQLYEINKLNLILCGDMFLEDCHRFQVIFHSDKFIIYMPLLFAHMDVEAHLSLLVFCGDIRFQIGINFLKS